MITHDLGVVADIADKIMVMYAGHPVEFGPAEEIFYNSTHPYTWGLIRSIPDPVMTEKYPLTPIKGNPPSLVMPACRLRLLSALSVCHGQVPRRAPWPHRGWPQSLLLLPLCA